MIELSRTFDLGRDQTRMKDPRDGKRQTVSAAALLKRLFHSDQQKRWELQILADEVGMGKTFVALAVAFTLLEEMIAGRPPAGLDGCYQKVVILTPANASLLQKWYREVSEFVKRCVPEAGQAEAGRWFKPIQCDRIDDFVRLLQKPGTGARIIVAPMDIFGEKKLRYYDLKRRFLLAALFRYWGNRLQIDRRERLLRGAPDGWPRRPDELGKISDDDSQKIPCYEHEAVAAIARLDRVDQDGNPSKIETLLSTCREISEPYTRNRVDLFHDNRVERDLSWLYREVMLTLLGSAVPLVIVDEAHNWKHGPETGANGYKFFAKYLAARTRRGLLLTATPFQLHPKEMLELLKIGEALEPAPERSGLAERRARIRSQRELLERVLSRATDASVRFAGAWSKMPPEVQSRIDAVWCSLPFERARAKIEEVARKDGVAEDAEIRPIVQEATDELDPSLRSFFCEALFLFAHNRDLSSELGPVVVRHRRKTEHRLFRVGAEYVSDAVVAERRPDSHVLHASPGLDVSGPGELPHYLLMRCVSETKKGRGRSSLGSALTGCYSTLLESAEGRRVKGWLHGQADAAPHFRLLEDMVSKSCDPEHPKLAAVVKRVLAAWTEGEKTLLFCFRTNTAERLRDIIRDQIADVLTKKRKVCLGGESSLIALRGRLTGRDRDLIPLGLDRVLWSLQLTNGFGQGWPFAPSDLELQDSDVRALAALSLRYNVVFGDERVDRVFLTRAVEHLVAQRLSTKKPVGLVGNVLRDMASPTWVEWPYGRNPGVGEDDEDDAGEEVALRGVNSHYKVEQEEQDDREVEVLAAKLLLRRQRARTTNDTSIFDVDAEGPSLWFGGAPRDVVVSPNFVALEIHRHLAVLTMGDEGLDWESRRLVMEALRRALLRVSVLVRLLPTKTERHERAWGDLLVEAYWQTGVNGQHESMAHRIEVFLEDLKGASGRFDDPRSARATILDATRLRDQQFVALVKGGDQKSRERVFAGFNSPLLPDVLVCTSVGAEGIDLHRHCRHVVHYDLAWNPAVLEQRTGRIDRIGSKTFRERELARSEGTTYLEVGVPFLAGTYDERMYEELRMRAQIFEVLTGGDVAADSAEGNDDSAAAEGKERELQLVALPPRMIDELRVRLDVWQEIAD